jgi:hypothetical protein
MLLKLYKLGEKHALAAPGANTDIFATDLRPNCGRSAMRVTVSLAVSSVLNVTITNGTTKYTIALFDGAALPASALRSLTFSCGSAYSYNLQVATNGIIQHLLVEEIAGGVI